MMAKPVSWQGLLGRPTLHSPPWDTLLSLSITNTNKDRSTRAKSLSLLSQV